MPHAFPLDGNGMCCAVQLSRHQGSLDCNKTSTFNLTVRKQVKKKHRLLLILTGHHWKEYGSLVFTHFHQIFLHAPEPSFPQAEHSQLCQPFVGEVLQSLPHLHGPLLDSLQYVRVSLVLGNQGLNWALCMSLTRAKEKGSITAPCPLAMLSQCSLEGCWPHLLQKHIAGLWSTHSPGSPGPFGAKLLCSQSVPSTSCCIGFCLPRCGTLHFTESQNVRGWKGPLWVI